MNEQQQEIASTNVYRSCVICGNPGVEKYSEVLPDKGVLIKMIHDDGKICEFVEYASISSFMERGKKKKEPKMMDRREELEIIDRKKLSNPTNGIMSSFMNK